LLAAIVGAMLALGGVFLLEYLDDTIKDPDLVRDQTGMPTLAAVVTIPGAGPAERLVTLSSTRSPAAEAYRVLRTNLQFSSLDKPVRTLLVSSPSPGEGKTTTAANLAAVMAQAGQRVVLVDCDLRRPNIHRLFQVANNNGLTTALLHAGADPAAFLQETSLPGLQVLTTGPIPPNPSELLSSERMHELLEKLQAQADMVVLDSPPVLAVADASILATRADGTLLVVSAGETRLDMLVKALERLDGLSVRPLGLVLNKLSERRGGYYYYYYYQYARRYGDDDSSPKPNGRRPRRAARQRKADQAL
jgi:non-specific protein-tyrosine kinase